MMLYADGSQVNFHFEKILEQTEIEPRHLLSLHGYAP